MNKNEKLRKLPSVDIILKEEQIIPLVKNYGQHLVTYVARNTIETARQNILNNKEDFNKKEIVESIVKMSKLIAKPSLKPVINATGIILHTNLGRAPLGQKVLDDIKNIVLGYSNLEFDLDTAYRGKRDSHLNELLKFITGAEAAIVVNNNAAAIILALNTLAKDKEVIISRGELIEIGGSFRIPEIMSTSGAKMVEVGTTNKTRLSDYETAINANTAMIFKAHKSNFEINGFTEETTIKELAKLANKKGIPFFYDIGSGLLRKPQNLSLENEPDVKQALADGSNIVSFSTDKLLGGPQAGIIVGDKNLIEKLKKSPMMRALRVGKLTIAALQSVIRNYFDNSSLIENTPLFSMLETKTEFLKEKAKKLKLKFERSGINAQIVESVAQCGGGTLPHLKLNSFAVKIISDKKSQRKRSIFAEKIHQSLLQTETPILGVLRKGEILFDVLTIDERDFDKLINSIKALR